MLDVITTLGKDLADFCKVKHTPTLLPSNSFSGIYPREMKTYVQKKTCSGVLIGNLFIIAQSWKQPRCLPTGELVNELWYYSDTKRN